MKKILTIVLTTLCLATLMGCGEKKTSTLSAEAMDAITNLDSIQANYAAGTAPMIEIPTAWAEELYNNADDIIGSDVAGAPILLREYAVTNVVYYDYSDDYSVVWDKNTGSVTVEPTDTAERDDFMQKQHK